jgi:hypothetical protein
MQQEFIYNTTLDHNGDVKQGLAYLRNHWNDQYVLDVFENARTSYDRSGDFRVDNVPGTYILKFIAEHHYSLSWKSY